MSFLKRLFKNNKDSEVIIETKIPDYVEAANKTYNKEFDSAIDELSKQLEDTDANDYTKLAMIHINLMQAYFKNRTKHDNYFKMSSEHAKKALICGHNTGLAPFRLIVNLEKEGNLFQAMEVCKLVIDNRYYFSPTGYKQKPEFMERLEKLQKKAKKDESIDHNPLFTKSEIELAIKNSHNASI